MVLEAVGKISLRNRLTDNELHTDVTYCLVSGFKSTCNFEEESAHTSPVRCPISLSRTQVIGTP